jgi:5-methylcytosine-specific restriction endonuclease McrA
MLGIAAMTGPDPESPASIRARLRRDVELRQQSYRGQALRMLPHVCGRCGREFSGKRLRELTVHHKDHNYEHNPPDGSNWELLCLYCHDDEHAPDSLRAMGDGPSGADGNERSAIASPFQNLNALLDGKGAAPGPHDKSGD